MSKPSLLYSISKILPTLGEVRLDAATSEQHASTARVTSIPVESGAQISDHIILEPEHLTIEGLLTDSPLQHQTARDGNPDPNGGDQSSGSRAIDAYEKLLQLLRDREPITVVTGLRSYRNMALIGVSAPRESESGAALKVSLELVRIDIAESVTVAGQKRSKGGGTKRKAKVAPKRNDCCCDCQDQGQTAGQPGVNAGALDTARKAKNVAVLGSWAWIL